MLEWRKEVIMKEQQNSSIMGWPQSSLPCTVWWEEIEEGGWEEGGFRFLLVLIALDLYCRQ